ncbi:MAG: hypothetical protein M1823_004130 [Watsoniomyces obsoletus]|nr:MAG: hypothetical protein M1823_004130 [Watsoniomyces obsoletus]
MPEHGKARTVLALLRNLGLAVLLYGAIFAVVEWSRTGSIDSIARLQPSRLRSRPSPPPSLVDPARPAILGPAGREVEITRNGVRTKAWLNPHANSFNRPKNSTTRKDDYLGPRPHVDTVANLPMLVERCRGSLAKLEMMRNVSSCMTFLAQNEHEYYTLPAREKRASHQDPQRSEYTLPAQHDSHRQHYPSPEEAVSASKDSIGTCAGPVIPYHVYWTGPATWRVEVFIKSYLHTQNLACSRLWLWLDADGHANVVQDMLQRDPLFARFLPLVERGDILVKEWRFPSRIPLPRGLDDVERAPAKNPHGGPGHVEGETVVADGVVEDGEGQRWLIIPPKQMTFLPVAVSDAVRFVVLHLHGGLYLDMDVLMIRDMRPLLLPDPVTGQHSFAERWAAHPLPSDYNTAIMSLTANSSLSSYLVRGGVRMGLNFHPRVIGRMAWKDDRNGELLMLESAAVDSIWAEFDGLRVGTCTVPCLKDYGEAFKATVKKEWAGYGGVDDRQSPSSSAAAAATASLEGMDSSVPPLRRRKEKRRYLPVHEKEEQHGQKGNSLTNQDSHQGNANEKKHASVVSSSRVKDEDDSHNEKDDEDQDENNDEFKKDESRLRLEGAILDYRLDDDPFPPTNRSMEHFFRGAWTYHIHNQWRKNPQPTSWLWTIQQAHDDFFARRTMNPYGESWPQGLFVKSYDVPIEYL